MCCAYMIRMADFAVLYTAMAEFAPQLRDPLSRGDIRRTVRAFQSVTRATEAQLDQFWLRAYRAGNQLGIGVCEVASDLLTLDAFTFRGMTRTLINTMQYSAGALAVMAPNVEGRATLQEFQNKLLVFNLFENVDTVLGLSPETDLNQLIARTAVLDGFDAVWAMEGIGHYYTENVWETKGRPHGLLRAVEVPAKSLVALHAGMGLSLANRMLSPVGETASSLRSALQRFVSLCRDNSREADLGASYEALGLVARNLYPHLIARIDGDLSGDGEHLADYFWHGVGRAIYFAPTNYVPLSSSSVRIVEMTQREPPHQAGQSNALAGAIWALFLVNLREPEVIENFLIHCEQVKFDEDAFANGVSSAAIIWGDSTDDTALLEALCRYQPCAGVFERWNNLVRVPCLDALKGDGSIGERFRYRCASRQAALAVTENSGAGITQEIDRIVSQIVHTLSHNKAQKEPQKGTKEFF